MRNGFYTIGDELGLTSEEVLGYTPALNSVFGYEACFLIEPWRCLHGTCDVFALALARRFGYGLRVYWAKKGKSAALIHAVAFSDKCPGPRHFVDVRGITDKEDEMLETFVEDIGNYEKRGYTLSITDYVPGQAGAESFAREVVGIVRSESSLVAEAENIISECPEMFEVPAKKGTGSRIKEKGALKIAAVALSAVMALCLSACAQQGPNNTADNALDNTGGAATQFVFENVSDVPMNMSSEAQTPPVAAPAPETAPAVPVEPQQPAEEPQQGQPEPVQGGFTIEQDMRAVFDHGPKDVAFQRYIVLHDTEVDASPYSIIDSWENSGNCVASHFIIGKDGTIVQCVPLDRIAHHAGFGDAGHNDAYGIVEDGRDEMVGTVPIGDWAPDYAMNAWSVGIEMVHVGGEGYYPEEQLAALDWLIGYIDGCFGNQSAIIDHKAWRSGNSDTSPEFAGYLENCQNMRHH